MMSIWKHASAILLLQLLTRPHLHAMEKEQLRTIEPQIILPTVPAKKLLESFPVSAIPWYSAVAGTIKLEDDDGNQVTIKRSAAERSETLKMLISETGTEEPLSLNACRAIFQKLVDSLNALDNVTLGFPQYESIVKVLVPIVDGMSFEDTIQLLKESNRLEIKALTWYIAALFATKLDESKDAVEISAITKSLNNLVNVRDQVVQMLELLGPYFISIVFPVPTDFKVTAFSFAHQKGILALAKTHDQKAMLWNVATATKELELSVAKSTITALAMSADGRLGFAGLEDGSTTVWDLATGKTINTLEVEIGPELRETLVMKDAYAISLIALSPDATLALIASKYDKSVYLFDLKTGKLIRSLSAQLDFYYAVHSLAISADNNYALMGTSRNQALYWDLRSGEILKKFGEPAYYASLSPVAFSPNYKQALIGSRNNYALIWDLASGELVIALKGNNDMIISVAFSPDGKRALTAAKDKTIRLWEAETGKEIGHLRPMAKADITSLLVSPDGNYVLAGISDGKEALIWRINRFKELPQQVLFMKLNQLGAPAVMENSYFSSILSSLGTKR